MPQYARVQASDDDWYFETSATPGLQAPLKSINREATVMCAMRIGESLIYDAQRGYAWIDFSRWTRNVQYGMEVHEDSTFQLYFTKYGSTVTYNWDTMLVPVDAKKTQPVLIYDYDSHCFRFCDRTHFWNKSVIADCVMDMFSAAQALPSVDGGNWVDVHEYMSGFDLSEDEEGYPRRPAFAN